jgi:hypothetical protein
VGRGVVEVLIGPTDRVAVAPVTDEGLSIGVLAGHVP